MAQHLVSGRISATLELCSSQHNHMQENQKSVVGVANTIGGASVETTGVNPVGYGQWKRLILHQFQGEGTKLVGCDAQCLAIHSAACATTPRKV